MSSRKKKLGAFSVAAGLVGIHYGPGFLLGTGEKVVILGLGGSIYAVSCGLGLLALTLFSPIYHKHVDRIEILMKRHFKSQAIGISIALLSLLWMIGVVAAQIMSVTYVLQVWKVVDVRVAMIIVAFLIGLVSSFELDAISLIFTGLLALSSIGLVISLIASGNSHLYIYSLARSWGSYRLMGAGELLGIGLTTILLTMIGMDFHQFVVKARTPKTGVIGCSIASVALLFMAFLPTSVALASQKIGIEDSGKTVLPLMLAYVEKQLGVPFLGVLFIVSLLATAIGSGAGVNKAVAGTFRSLLREYVTNDRQKAEKREIISSINKKISLKFGFTDRVNGLLHHFPYTLSSAFLSLLIATTGKTIVDLIVSSYAIYVAGAFIPFVVFLLDYYHKIDITSNTVLSSIIVGASCSMAMLLLWQPYFVPHVRWLRAFFLHNLEFAMVGAGLTASISTIMIGLVVTKVRAGLS